MLQLQTTDYKHFRVVKADGSEFSFEGAGFAKPALPGDIVEVKGGIVAGVVKRAKHPHLVGTLELASKFRFGMTSRNVPIYRFTPMNESYPPFFVGCSQKDVSRNMLALIEFASWDAGTCPKGNLVRIFGACGDLVAEEEALLANACLTTWKKADTEDLNKPGPCKEMRKTIGETFHIDPPGCRDIDDAITLRYINSIVVEVKIHIADVASWLIINPKLHAKAADIAQTYYIDGAAVKPMFPQHLSEGLFSLLPGQERRAWTLSFLWDTVTKKPPTMLVWSLETLTVAESYTYVTIYSSPHAALLRDITSVLAGRDVTDSHEWVEQFMLLYNKEVAYILKEDKQGILRRHAGKDMTRYADMKALGLPADRLAMHGGEYCLPTEPDTMHWGLGATAYCHASSPIRRWADCINQIALREEILGYSEYILTPPTQEKITDLNQRAKRAKAFERDILFARLLMRSPTDIPLHAVVAEIQPTKTKLWVSDWGRMVTSLQSAEGFVPGDDVHIKYFADPTQRSWKRRVVIQFSKPLNAYEN